MKSLFVSVMTAVLLVFTSSLNADEVAEMSNCVFAGRLRRAIGLGPQDSAILGISLETHGTIVGDVESFCTENRETLEPLLTTFFASQGDAMHAYELAAEDIADKDSAYVSANDALIQACDDLITTVNARLTTNQRTQWENRRSHPLLDSTVAALTLDSEQVSNIQTAQRTRDQTLRHMSNRKNLTASATATQTFETALAGILNEGQETTLAAAREALADDVAGIAADEEVHCND